MNKNINSAWLILEIDINGNDKIINIKNSKISISNIGKYIEDLYYIKNFNIEDSIYYLNKSKNKRPYKYNINKNKTVDCGHNPFICAKRVYDLHIDENGVTKYTT